MLYRDCLNNIKRECPVCVSYHEPAYRICPNCKHEYKKKDRIDLRQVDKWTLPRLKRVNRAERGKEAEPPWLTEKQKQEIKRIYRSRKEGEHVDHIVPINGKGVCGLHVPWNLQVITKEENIRKGNRWWPDMWTETP